MNTTRFVVLLGEDIIVYFLYITGMDCCHVLRPTMYTLDFFPSFGFRLSYSPRVTPPFGLPCTYLPMLVFSISGNPHLATLSLADKG